MPGTTTNFIAQMIRRHSDELEFIPTTTITERWVRPGLFVIQRDRDGEPIGYLLHGYVNDDRTLYIHHACLALHEPDRPSARRAVTRLVKRASNSDAHRILLRCPSNVVTIDFWHNLGFIPVAISEAGTGKPTTLVQYELTLTKNSEQLDSRLRPEALRPNV